MIDGVEDESESEAIDEGAIEKGELEVFELVAEGREGSEERRDEAGPIDPIDDGKGCELGEASVISQRTKIGEDSVGTCFRLRTLKACSLHEVELRTRRSIVKSQRLPLDDRSNLTVGARSSIANSPLESPELL